MEYQMDYKAIGALSLEINQRIKLIKDIFPKDKEPLLNNLAAAAIHITTFMMELYEDKEGLKPNKKRTESFERFLEKCGCKDERMD